MIPFVVTFILGIIFEKVLNFGWAGGALVFLISIFLFFYFKKEDSSMGKIILVVGVAFFVGSLRMSLVDVSADQNLLKLVGQKISLEATISDEPDVRDDVTRYTVNIENSKSLILLIADRFPEFKYGDKIKVSGKLDLPKNFEGDNGIEFDYISYLAKDKINFLIYHPEIKKLEGYGGNKIIATLYSIKNIFINKISKVVPEPNSSLLAGIIFGTKQSLGTDLLDDFKKVGLIHIVVLSGYNITIIAVGVFYLTSFLRRRNVGFILAVLFIILFATMVGWEATVVRAVVMALISILAVYLGRPSDALRWLFIAGFLMILWNPVILFYDPSFQLSFMATFGLILFSQFILNFITEHKFAKYIPEKFGIREIVASTLAVQFFVLPLLIKMSGFVSLISFIINPIILPLVPWVMASGAATGALGAIPLIGEFLSWPFGIISFLISQIIISITEFSARIPFATIQTGSISIWLIFVWYLAYAILFMKLKKNSARSLPS